MLFWIIEDELKQPIKSLAAVIKLSLSTSSFHLLSLPFFDQ